MSFDATTPVKAEVLVGDCREVLPTLPAASVHTVVTSPPYWGLRDYYGTGRWEGGDAACVHFRPNQARAAASSTPMRSRCTKCGAVRPRRRPESEAKAPTAREIVAAHDVGVYEILDALISRGMLERVGRRSLRCAGGGAPGRFDDSKGVKVSE